MYKKQLSNLIIVILMVAVTAAGAIAMTWHVARPYQCETYLQGSNPFVFFSRQSETMLFDKQKEVLIICQPVGVPISLKWSVSRNFFKTPIMTGAGEPQVNNGYLIRIPTAKLRPGFYDVNVELNTGADKTVHGVSAFGWKINEIRPTVSRPADFDAFWGVVMKELASTPLDAKVIGPVRVMDDEKIAAYNVASSDLPPDYDPTGHRAEKVEVYKVNYASADGSRCYGWLAKPVGNGPFPAMLVLPGAAGGPRPIPAEQARHGYVALAIQVHGQDVDLEKYDQPDFIPGKGPKENYDYRIYTNALQSVSYLASRADVDKSKIVVVGQSQGGRLSTVVSGLDKRVAAAVPCLAHNAYGAYQAWARACNSANPPRDGMDRDNPPMMPEVTEANRWSSYYDTMNFAFGVTCPVFAFAGMIDAVSPVTTTYCTYSLMPSTDKHVFLTPGLFHEWSPEFDRRAWRWLDGKLGLK